MEVDSPVDRYPLSPMQQGMLFHHLTARRPWADCVQIVCALHESVDVPAFQLAWERVADRHETFRTTFSWNRLDDPLQEVRSAVALPFDVEDWRGVPAALQDERMAALVAAQREREVDLTRLPLVRITLIQLADAEFRCIWSFPDLLFDGRSLSIVLREVFAFHEAARRGERPELERPRPYRAYIEWLTARDASRDEAFWRALLAGFTAPTSIAVAGPVCEGRGEQDLRLSASLTAALGALAERNGLSLSSVVLGAWALLLGRYAGTDDVVFGAAHECRRLGMPGAEDIVGLFINTLPVRVRLPPEARLVPWLQDLRAQQRAVREFEHTPLVNVQKWSGVAAGTQLFDSIVVFDRAWLQAELRALGGPWTRREFQLVERTSFPFTLYAYAEPELWLRLAYDRDRLADPAASRMLGHLQTLLAGVADDPQRSLASIPMLTEEERHTQLVEWNDTATPVPPADCVHQQFAAQARSTPDTVALVCGEQHLTYRELDTRANRLARHLQKLGVGPDVLVGICAQRSIDMVVGILGVLKAGGAYVPLDPSYPPDRLGLMLEDARVSVLLTQQSLRGRLPSHSTPVLCLDAVGEILAGEDADLPATATRPEHLAYVIYTSGSTGTPKGVMVEHRSVVNFFAAMDERVGHEPPGTWLALTSLSFDISVLELLWTLTRGWKVVVHVDPSLEGAPTGGRLRQVRSMDLSLSYFASAGSEQSADQYRLLLDGARFADRHGFAAVWTPERHFHSFGGLYPNPSVTAAAIAAITERIQIRAGSVVLPLHHPVRVAEEWALVDNLSNGRVGVSFASGWQPEDFVLAPGNYAERKELMYRHIETVRRLWRGEALSLPGVTGTPVVVRTLPRPVQRELPVWVTSAGSVETYEAAGRIGANLLTHLLGQTVEELGDRIAVYRRSRQQHGHGPGRGHVTLMVHTFVGEDDDSVREIVRQPMIEYLRSSVSLIKNFAGVWAAHRRMAADATPASAEGDEFQKLGPEDMEALLAFAFERYFETSGLLGATDTCLRMLERLKVIDVDEVACLIDFGVNPEVVLAHLPHLNQLKQRVNAAHASAESIPDLIDAHGVTHMQCTPSMARLLLADTSARDALRTLRMVLVGGEALTADLAAALQEVTGAEILNMYGPTETTVWSATHRVNGAHGAPPIGRPIANTEFYILDRHLRPLPVGVVGELFIGGSGLARGYLRRPELTAERFVPHPFRHDAGARVYRTGDLARYRPDGTVEFLGRTDHQVKIRGHRIELGEIEHALNQHSGVREAVVVAVEDAPGDVRLVAYLGVDGASSPTSSALRDFLARRLPAAMVPASFVPLPALPRTPNGKVDRRALPTQEYVHADRETPVATPRTPIEATLAEIWRRVLRVERVGFEDSFLDLGGNSLSTIQVAFGIRRALQIDLPLQAILAAPTLRALAAQVEEKILAQAGDATLAQLLGEVEQLSDEEARALTEQELRATLSAPTRDTKP